MIKKKLNKKAILTKELLELIVAVAVIVILIWLFVELISSLMGSNYDKNEETAKSFFKQLNEKIDKVTNTNPQKLFIWGNEKIYLAHFGKNEKCELRNPQDASSLGFLESPDKSKNYLCVCYESKDENLKCKKDYCMELDKDSELNFGIYDSKKSPWAFMPLSKNDIFGVTVYIKLLNEKYVFDDTPYSVGELGFIDDNRIYLDEIFYTPDFSSSNKDFTFFLEETFFRVSSDDKIIFDKNSKKIEVGEIGSNNIISINDDLDIDGYYQKQLKKINGVRILCDSKEARCAILTPKKMREDLKGLSIKDSDLSEKVIVFNDGEDVKYYPVYNIKDSVFLNSIFKDKMLHFINKNRPMVFKDREKSFEIDSLYFAFQKNDDVVKIFVVDEKSLDVYEIGKIYPDKSLWFYTDFVNNNRENFNGLKFNEYGEMQESNVKLGIHSFPGIENVNTESYKNKFYKFLSFYGPVLDGNLDSFNKPFQELSFQDFKDKLVGLSII